MSRLESIFSLMLTASLASTAILLVLLLLRKLLVKRLSPKTLHVLWFLVLVKLLVPIAPQSPVSLFNLMPQAVHDVSWESDSESSRDTVKNSEEASPVSDPVPNQTEELVSAGASANPPPQANAYEKDRDGLNRLTIGSLVWLGGLIVLSLYYLLVTLRFRKKVGASRKLDNQEALSVLEACMEKLNISITIPVYGTTSLHSPCIYGLTKPRIYLPEDIVTIADSRQLTHILLHELTHYKRKDLWFNCLWTLAVLIHWYNPFVWLAMRKMKADREVACDAGVLEVLGERESPSYGMTLLMLSRLFSRASSPRVNLSPFFENKNEMKRRITMIAKFRKGSYKLSAVAILLVLSLSAVMLTNASETAKSADSVANSSLKIERLNDWAKWFNNLERANDYSGFRFKVPDYLPEGYRLENVVVEENYVNRTDNLAFFTFVSNFGKEDRRVIELVASKGNILSTHDLVWGTGNIAPYSWGAAQALTYRHDEVTLANIQGTLVTQKQNYERHEPETAKSFVWQDEGVWYAINYYSENHTLKEGHPLHWRNISQDELEKIVQSMTFPEQIRHVSYDGKGNSFPLYDETDLREAKDILGFKVKFPLELSNNQLRLIDSKLLKAGDQNTGYSFRPNADAIRNSYRVPYDSKGGELNDELGLYQSKVPLVDVAKLSFIRALDLNGVEVSVCEDTKNVYDEYQRSSTKDTRSQTYYLWKQDGIYYTAVFLGLDKNREENIKTLILAPPQ